MDDLGYVVRVFHEEDLEANWQSIGQTLQVTYSKQPNDDDAKCCLLHILANWLKGQTTLNHPPPSWKGVVWVIADPDGGGTVPGARRVAARFRGIFVA